MNLRDPIIDIKGIGNAKEKLFRTLGIYKIGDLIEYYPISYEDRTKLISIEEAMDNHKSLIKATITSNLVTRKIRSNLSITKARAGDHLGSFEVVWYNSPYIGRTVFVGKTYYFYGKVKKSFHNIQMEMPEIFELHAEDLFSFIPKYSLTKGLTHKDIRKAIKNVFNKSITVEDYLSQELINKYKLMGLKEAYEKIHYAKNREDLSRARHRLIFNEFLEIQIAFRSMKEETKKDPLPFFLDDNRINQVQELLNILPFQLTLSQKEVLEELYKDIRMNKQINRLIQGDVGSGKTIVAVIMLFICLLNGYQGVMMVPTAILAEQHYEYISDLFSKLNIGARVGLMTKFKTTKQRLEYLHKIATGEYNLIVATHGVLQEDVEFSNLGLVITDEQHRFGVRQRKQLSNKGKDPHIIVMSATPIPRTTSLVLYGDLEVSTINTLPAGRKPIKTYSVNTGYRSRIYKMILNEISEGRQAYILCPSIEINDQMNSAEEVYEKCRNGAFRDIPIGLLHGKMSGEEKEEVMRAFYENKIKVLICTTVVEVGINVPNATIMLIENAERFGLAQLHQLRGRVGRGEHQSHCILLTDSKSHKTKQRMDVLIQSTDGFYISERDLELRGPGDYFGFRQHGLPSFKLADLSKHQSILLEVNEMVEYILHSTEQEYIKKKVLIAFQDKLDQISMN
ncbi:ATP-dependent DNA helicase RecG [Alkalibaculum bacchi]|uniref:ATP-dependent DNA helicase RecG n=1 Tax=Alkalibaculum bacchi TaxID=645887 RepID=UPI0026EE08A3|nr:ATP-dependent DNA helicase RecG [Alkalibaculum bacchi]